MPWRVVTIVWPVLVAALWPLDLAGLIVRFPAILARLAAIDTESDSRERAHRRSRPHQVDDFRSRLAPYIRKAA